MLSAYFIILLGCVNLALSLDYDDFINNFRAIARGTDAPEGSYKHVGRIQYNITRKRPDGTTYMSPIEGTGFFIKHIGPYSDEKPYFLTVAHMFDQNVIGLTTDQYIKPGRTSKISLVSKGTIGIFYGSVKKEEQKVFNVYPNGLYTPTNCGEAHIVRVPSAYPFDETDRPDVDMTAIELTKDQANQFVNDGGIFAVSKDDSPEKLFQAGEVCKIGAWGFTNVDEDGPIVKPTRLQQANIMVKDLDYCTNTLPLDEPLRNMTNFACFGTRFSSDSDPQIRDMDSGAPVVCGTGDGLVATLVSASDEFSVIGPTRGSILAFVKDCFYD